MAQRALGRRPPSNKRALQLGDILTGVAPTHPAAVDHFGSYEFGLYANDQFGDCGPVSVANLIRLVTAGLTGQMIKPSQEDVFDLYRRSGNPRFNPVTGEDDNGVIMQDMLDALLAGGIGGIKPVAFAKVDVSDDMQLEAAVSIFGGVLWGVDLRIAQQHQTDMGRWDYVGTSGDWGGHAIVDGAYASDVQDVITWGERVRVTDAFRRHQLEEAWVVVWPWNLEHPAFQEGVDLDALRGAYRALTGRELPVPDPAPTPAPEPVTPGGGVPEPAGCFLVGPLSAHRQAQIERHAKAHNMTVEDYLTLRLERGRY